MKERPKIQALPRDPEDYTYVVNGFVHQYKFFSFVDAVVKARSLIAEGGVKTMVIKQRAGKLYEYHGNGERMDFHVRVLGATNQWN